MSTLQISAPFAAERSSAAASRRPGPVLRAVAAVVDALAETNRRRAEREIARVSRSYGLGIADRA